MNFTQLNNKSIEQSFSEYDANNPAVYELFVKLVLQWVEQQRLAKRTVIKVSSKQVIGRIRWYYTVEVKSNNDFKINDAFTALYARKFIADYPQYKNIFELRQLRADYQRSLL